jgi:hypothetical protein
MGLNAIGLGGLGLGFGLAGGGGVGGGGSGGGGTTAAKAPTSSIKVVDGPISGAKVYLDMNDNGKYDASIDKLVGTTDANGSLDIASASLGQHGLLAVGGTNDNGMPSMSTLSLAAVANTSAPLLVLSPLTSLVSAVYLRSLQSNSKTSFTDAEKATKLSEAESAVKSALGLDTVSASFSSIDPTGAGGLQLLKAGAVLAEPSAAMDGQALAEGLDALQAQALDGSEVSKQLEDLTGVVLSSAEVSTRSAEVAASISEEMRNVMVKVDEMSRRNVLHSRVMLVGLLSFLMIAVGTFFAISTRLQQNIRQLDVLSLAVGKRVVELDATLAAFGDATHGLGDATGKLDGMEERQVKLDSKIEARMEDMTKLFGKLPEQIAGQVNGQSEKSLDAKLQNLQKSKCNSNLICSLLRNALEGDT